MPNLIGKSSAIKTAALLTVAFWGISHAQGFFVPLCFSALLAFLLTPGVRFLRTRGLPEVLALVMAASLFIIPLLAIGYETVSQSEAMIRQGPAIIKLLHKDLVLIANTPWGIRLDLAERFELTSL